MHTGLKHCLWIVTALFLLGAGAGQPPAESRPGATADAGSQSAGDLPPITGQVTFLYFNDVDRAAEFYERILGLKKTFDAGWVRIFAVSPSSSVGLVDGAKGAHKPSKDKPVTVALVVSDVKDVDRWYEYLKARGVSIHKPPADGESVNVREFRFTDPEGHTLEVFSWRAK